MRSLGTAIGIALLLVACGGSDDAAGMTGAGTAEMSATTMPSTTTEASPTTEAAPTSTRATVAPTTTLAPAINVPCEVEGTVLTAIQLACVRTGYGLLWIFAPFVAESDGVGFSGEPTDEADVGIITLGGTGLFSFGVKGPRDETSSLGDRLWCFFYGVENHSNVPLSYGPFDMSLLTPSGALLRSSIPFGYEPLPDTGQVSPEGAGGDWVCFDRQDEPGRYALVYAPFLVGNSERALAYFDR